MAAGRVGSASRFKTGHRGDHRLWRGVERPGRPEIRELIAGDFGKTGHRGDHRLWRRKTSERRPGRSPSASACEPYPRSHRTGAVARPQRHGDLAGPGRSSTASRGYQSVKRFVRKLRGSAPAQARVVIVTAPGEEAQVDYGTGPMVRDPQPASIAARGCS